MSVPSESVGASVLRRLDQLPVAIVVYVAFAERAGVPSAQGATAYSRVIRKWVASCWLGRGRRSLTPITWILVREMTLRGLKPAVVGQKVIGGGENQVLVGRLNAGPDLRGVTATGRDELRAAASSASSSSASSGPRWNRTVELGTVAFIAFRNSATRCGLPRTGTRMETSLTTPSSRGNPR